MTVVTMASARVQDLIGLICWQYTSEGREPKLNDNVSAYCLHIAEDDGEVDTDFPRWMPMSPFISLASVLWPWLRSIPRLV